MNFKDASPEGDIEELNKTQAVKKAETENWSQRSGS
jgi:hypothetical protein